MSWLAGFVKEVQSGDTLVIASASTLPNGMLAERRLNLASLSAPRMPRRDGSGSSEEFAWESREFLRKLAIGRKCVFRVDYKIDTIDRDFGTVSVERDGTHIDLGLAVVKAGWAKVRGSKDAATQAKDIDSLQSAQEEAEEAGRGIHCSDPVVRMASSFTFDIDSAATGGDAIAAFGKGVPVAAVVDAVLTGSTLKLVTLPERAIMLFSLAGAQAPNVRRTTDGNIEGDPHGPQAKTFTELKVLNREVRAVLHSADTNGGRVYGELVYPEGDTAASLAATLLDAGMAKYIDWSARMLPVRPPAAIAAAAALKKAEMAAQAERRGMWATVEVPKAPASAGTAAVAGRVIEIVSGDTVVVRLADGPVADGRDVRMSLASIRAPRMRAQGTNEPEPWAREAKDYLRQAAIGAECKVALEYTRTVPPMLDASGGMARSEPLVMQFGNVEVQTKRGTQQLAEMMVARGYASVQGARDGDDRSSLFGALMAAEESAQQRRAGMHSGKEPAPTRLNDVSVPGSGPRAKQYLPFFQRAGTVPCVVEYVMAGSRLRLLVPKEGAVIAFSPSGVKTPSRGLPARGGQPAQKPEPFGEESFQFVRERFMQREAMVTVESCDRSGTFLGRIRVGDLDLSIALLSSGLGSLHPSFSYDRVSGAAALESAQESAQEARKGVWKDFGETAKAEEATAAATPSGPKAATVTHVASGTQFFVQDPEEPRVAWVARECAAAGAAAAPEQPVRLAAGQKVLAKFSVDGQWYRGYVESVVDPTSKKESAIVYFLDFGNKEKVAKADIRPLDAALAAPPPLATAAQLAFVRVPAANDADFGDAAADTLADIVGGGKRFTMRVIGRVRPAAASAAASAHPATAAGSLEVVLTPPPAASGSGTAAAASTGVGALADSVQAEMLRAGMARLQASSSLRGPAARSAARELQPAMEEALQDHVGIFRYGDPGDSDDEEDYRR